MQIQCIHIVSDRESEKSEKIEKEKLCGVFRFYFCLLLLVVSSFNDAAFIVVHPVSFCAVYLFWYVIAHG